jgi:cell division protein ZapA
MSAGSRPVSVRVAGARYEVVSNASEEELLRLADRVNAKVEELTPAGRSASPQAVLLAAMALAHELEQECARRASIERRTRELLHRVLGGIDDALSCTPDQ